MPNYFKIESGTLRLEFSSVWMWDVVKKVTAGLTLTAAEKVGIMYRNNRYNYTVFAH
jgi:hypothetical protein